MIVSVLHCEYFLTEVTWLVKHISQSAVILEKKTNKMLTLGIMLTKQRRAFVTYLHSNLKTQCLLANMLETRKTYCCISDFLMCSSVTVKQVKDEAYSTSRAVFDWSGVGVEPSQFEVLIPTSSIKKYLKCNNPKFLSNNKQRPRRTWSSSG